jgi:hypothetical protein
VEVVVYEIFSVTVFPGLEDPDDKTRATP